MSKLDPRLFDKEKNIRALIEAFGREAPRRQHGWTFSNQQRFLQNIKKIPRVGFKADDLIDPETGLPVGNAVFGFMMLPFLEDYYTVLDTGDYGLLESLFLQAFPVNFISPYAGLRFSRSLRSTNQKA